MSDWNELPTELKRKCVEHMDLITRFRFRCCSSVSRNLVDSIPTEIPRVLFAEKQGRYLLLIYTDIAKFLRLEFCEKNGETVVYESVDTLENTYRTVLPYPDHFEIAVLTLKSLILRPNIRVNVFEWSISDADWRQDRFNQFVGDAQLRAYHVNYPDGSNHGVFDRFYNRDGGLEYALVYEMPYPDDEVVPRIHVRQEKKGYYKKLCTFYMGENNAARMLPLNGTPEQQLTAMLDFLVGIGVSGKVYNRISFPCCSKETEKAIFDWIPLEVTRCFDYDTKVGTIEKYRGRQFCFTYSPSCGFTIMVGLLTDDIVDYMFEPCMKSVFCEHHQSPFERWFMKQQPRCLTEPFWLEYRDDETDESEEEAEDVTEETLSDEPHRGQSLEPILRTIEEEEQEEEEKEEEKEEEEEEGDEDVTKETLSLEPHRGQLLKPIFAISLLSVIFAYLVHLIFFSY